VSAGFEMGVVETFMRKLCLIQKPAGLAGFFRFCAIAVGLACLLGMQALAATKTPHVGYVYPAGGRPGTTFQVTLGGQFLDGATNVFFTGEGIKARVLEHTKPLGGKQVNLLRDRLQELRKGLSAAKASDQFITVRDPYNTNKFNKISRADAEKELAELRKKLANPNNIRPANPQIAEQVTLEVAIATNAAPGSRELRLRTAAGLTPPVVFQVGQWPEYIEKEQPLRAASKSALKSGETGRTGSISEMRIQLPATVNGQILPGDIDRYRFTARKNQKLVIVVSARELMPYLPDAVPGWFQATLGLFDARGHELAYNDDFRFQPDPILFFTVPADGEYYIEIKDAIFRGREDFVYRVQIGERPFITSIFPLGCRVGQTARIELAGWNLPVTNLTVPAQEPGIHPVSVTRDGLPSNEMPFCVDTLPECFEQEPNDSTAAAQAVSLPIIVNGRINSSTDGDVFKFSGVEGETIVAEVMARRLNSPLDSVLKLTDANGRVLAANDDHEDKGTGLNTHHADSYLRFTLPAAGTYYLVLSDTQQKGGPEYAYRLRISRPRPDFELRVTPSSLAGRGWSSMPITVHALRKDGMTNDIVLSLKNAPAGFTLKGGRIPGNTNQAVMSLQATAMASGEPVELLIEGRATIDGREVAHLAVPAEDMMQAFAYHHLVPSKTLLVSVAGRAQGAWRAAKADLQIKRPKKK